MLNKIILQIRILICRLIKDPLFIIKVENGNVTRVSGYVNNSFMNDCIEIVKRNEIRSAFVYAEKGNYGKAILKASVEIPGNVLQQLRNTWGFNS